MDMLDESLGIGRSIEGLSPIMGKDADVESKSGDMAFKDLLKGAG